MSRREVPPAVMLPVCSQPPDPATAVEGGLSNLHGNRPWFIEGNARGMRLGNQGSRTRSSAVKQGLRQAKRAREEGASHYSSQGNGLTASSPAK